MRGVNGDGDNGSGKAASTFIQRPESENKKNFRPISNLVFLSKLVERVVLSRLNEHVEKIGCSLPNQYGYKSGHNTESLIIKLTND